MTAARRSRARLPLAIASALAMLPAGHSHAAEDASGFALEEIVVTARKKAENLQETPIAISAFSGEALERRNIVNLSDFNEALPGIEVQAGNGVAGVANVYIRGVGQRNTEPNLDSGVAIYLDGVYLSRADGALLDMNDVGAVQVLRGPQGTLFGKNTTGGALLIETNRPTGEREGKVSLTVGNYDQLNAAGVINLPLIEDTLFTRLSVMSVEREGFMDNITLGVDYDNEDRRSAIWQLRWLPAEDLVVDLNLNYAKTDQRPRGLQCAPSSVNFGQGWLATLQNGAVRPSHGGKSLEDFCLDSAATDRYETVQDLGGGYHAENKGASLTVDWGIAEGLAIKSITAWRGTVAGQNDDLDPLSIAFLHRSNDALPFAKDRDTTQFSQEFDLRGDAMDGRLAWIGGVYYFREETTDSRTVGITGPFFIQNPLLPPTLDAVSYTGSATDLATDNEAWAVFAQGDWALGEQWKLTTGLRYTRETRELARESYRPDVPTLSTGGFVFPLQGIYVMAKGSFNPLHGFVLSDTDADDVEADAWTPMASLSYLIGETGVIDGGSAYLTLSKGFRSGGLSEAPSANLEEFDPEEVVSVELGLKIDAFDQRLRLNAALFDLQYDDRQLTTIVVSPTGSIAGATINAKKSSVRGLELESAFLPTEQLELGMNLAFYDDEIEDFEDVQLSLNTSGVLPGPGNDGAAVPSGPRCALSTTRVEDAGTVESCIIDRSDERLPRLPERSVMLYAQYFFETAIGSIVPRIQFSRKYEIEACFDRISCTSGDYRNDHEDLSARVTWISTDGRFSVAAYGSNLTDEDFVTGGQPLYDSWGFGGYTYAPPRMYGAEFTLNW